MKRALLAISVVVVIVAGCSGERNASDLIAPTGAGTIVVDARLIVGQEIPPIHLSTTQSPDVAYPAGGAPLDLADVMVTSSAGDTARYTRRFFQTNDVAYDWEGHASGQRLVVRPGVTYFLRVTTSDGRRVTAQTTTPDSFHVREWLLVNETTLEPIRRLEAPTDSTVPYNAPANQLIYQDGLVEARFDRGNALAFQMALFNLDPGSPFLIDADFLSEADKARLSRESASPPLDAPDGFTRLPWLAVWYEGRHRFVVYSIDRNWYDLARSTRFDGPGGLGFGSNAGDDFERPIFHLQGGIGLFGSAARDWTGFTVHPRP